MLYNFLKKLLSYRSHSMPEVSEFPAEFVAKFVDAYISPSSSPEFARHGNVHGKEYSTESISATTSATTPYDWGSSHQEQFAFTVIRRIWTLEEKNLGRLERLIELLHDYADIFDKAGLPSEALFQWVSTKHMIYKGSLDAKITGDEKPVEQEKKKNANPEDFYFEDQFEDELGSSEDERNFSQFDEEDLSMFNSPLSLEKLSGQALSRSDSKLISDKKETAKESRTLLSTSCPDELYGKTSWKNYSILLDRSSFKGTIGRRHKEHIFPGQDKLEVFKKTDISVEACHHEKIMTLARFMLGIEGIAASAIFENPVCQIQEVMSGKSLGDLTGKIAGKLDKAQVKLLMLLSLIMQFYDGHDDNFKLVLRENRYILASYDHKCMLHHSRKSFDVREGEEPFRLLPSYNTALFNLKEAFEEIKDTAATLFSKLPPFLKVLRAVGYVREAETIDHMAGKVMSALSLNPSSSFFELVGMLYPGIGHLYTLMAVKPSKEYDEGGRVFDTFNASVSNIFHSLVRQRVFDTFNNEDGFHKDVKRMADAIIVLSGKERIDGTDKDELLAHCALLLYYSVNGRKDWMLSSYFEPQDVVCYRDMVNSKTKKTSKNNQASVLDIFDKFISNFFKGASPL